MNLSFFCSKIVIFGYNLNRMEFATQKQWLIEEILRIQDADLIQKLKDLIQGASSSSDEKLEPMSLVDFYAKIDASEQAYRVGRVTSQEDLKNEILTWKNR
jgi:hypothetical protein